MERVPFLTTAAATSYVGMAPLPVQFLLDNVRSMYNVGAFFRTADAAGVERLYLSGITALPPKREITKTALGAEESVPWEPVSQILPFVVGLQQQGIELVALETSRHAIDIYDWQPRFPVCVISGHETEGVLPEVLALCDTHVGIPMLGRKHSLNVSVAGGVVAYELLRKYRALREA